jgi:hypothetical protein
MLKQLWLLVANQLLTIVAIVGGLALLFKALQARTMALIS